MSKNRFVILFAVAFALMASSSISPATAGVTMAGKCLPKFNEMKATAKHWMIFAANEPNANGQACGWTQGFPAKEPAITKAMSECVVSEATHPGWGKKGTCRVVFTK